MEFIMSRLLFLSLCVALTGCDPASPPAGSADVAVLAEQSARAEELAAIWATFEAADVPTQFELASIQSHTCRRLEAAYTARKPTMSLTERQRSLDEWNEHALLFTRMNRHLSARIASTHSSL
jgi:hypothetical protein